MKKIILSLLIVPLAMIGCRKDDDKPLQKVDVATQNSYDDEAAQAFLENNYFDAQGNVRTFTDKEPADSTRVKLSSLNPVKLPSGVIYVVRPGAQPADGRTLADQDVITLQFRATTYVAEPHEGKTIYQSPINFYNTVNGTGTPTTDPSWYYVKKSVLDANKNVTRSYFEIEGFQEAIKHFKSYDQPDEANYNLQGVIIVPSRAAFARDPHFNYINYNLNDRTFVFNFQLYRSHTRTEDEK
ncbi:MAG: hypothetical protein EAS48_01335 [Chryseobacterium sp.]|nr:MAG: hypothetical protein EAS48_01335 [Chryseobacterium sp.]